VVEQSQKSMMSCFEISQQQQIARVATKIVAVILLQMRRKVNDLQEKCDHLVKIVAHVISCNFLNKSEDDPIITNTQL
jgi:hypothetical protein